MHPISFLSSYGRIADPLHGEIPLELWPHLRLLLDAWMESPLSITLKARQLGVSWALAGFALWTAMTRDQARVLLLSKNQMDATLLLDKARFLYHALPDDIRAACTLDKSNSQELAFGLVDSRIVALPSTRDAGRGYASTLVIADEHAFHEFAQDTFAATKPTIDAGGSMILVSTAAGLGNLFHQLWTGSGGDACPTLPPGPWRGTKGPNGFTPLFLPWHCRPGRDDEWYAKQTREYPPHLLAAEYPADAREAFVLSGRPVFDHLALDAMARDAVPPAPSLAIDGPLASEASRGLVVYHGPRPGVSYLIGADVAEGRADGDASCAVVLDPTTGEEMAALHGRWPLDRFSLLLDELAQAYGGLLGVERNNHGHAVLYALKLRLADRQLQGDARYALYYHTPTLRVPVFAQQKTKLGDLGWLTTAASKATLIDELEVAVRIGPLQVHSAAARDELRVYQTLESGFTAAPAGSHDDRVIALAIAYQMRKWWRMQAPAVQKAGRSGSRAIRTKGLG